MPKTVYLNMNRGNVCNGSHQCYFEIQCQNIHTLTCSVNGHVNVVIMLELFIQ